MDTRDTPDVPDPEVDVSMPDEMRLREFSSLLGGLGYYAEAAMVHGGYYDVVLASRVQEKLIAANPEAAVMLDTVYDDSVNIGTSDADSFVDLLSDETLADLDVEALRQRAREAETISERLGDDDDPGSGDMVDIDID